MCAGVLTEGEAGRELNECAHRRGFAPDNRQHEMAPPGLSSRASVAGLAHLSGPFPPLSPEMPGHQESGSAGEEAGTCHSRPGEKRGALILTALVESKKK